VAKDSTTKIAVELRKALTHLNADVTLQAIIGSWKETRSDTYILKMLREWNKAQELQGMRTRPFECPYCGKITPLEPPHDALFAIQSVCTHCGEIFAVIHDKPEKLPFCSKHGRSYRARLDLKTGEITLGCPLCDIDSVPGPAVIVRRHA
jgi:endogenous inhibitor of DNA gyrase (YacG/DUF329 family)